MLLLRQVSRLVRENLTRRALRFNLVLDDVSITHVAFSPEFTHAVEAKQVCVPRPSTHVRPHVNLYLGCSTNSIPCCFPRGSSNPRKTGRWRVLYCPYITDTCSLVYHCPCTG